MRSPRTFITGSAIALFAISLLGGCMAQPVSGASPSRDRSLLTRDQLENKQFENLFDAVQALRSNWLLERGSDSFASPSRVLVYLDNVKLGFVDALRSLSTRNVFSVEHLDGLAASARYGVGHGAGVILVSTLSAASPSSESSSGVR